MNKRVTVEDILPLVAGLTPRERLKLIRLMFTQSHVDESFVYDAAPPYPEEFSGDEDPLAWEAEGWEGMD